MARNTNYTNHINIGIYGLRSFTNPQDTWNVVCSKWGNDEDCLQILNDETFRKAVVERVIELVVKNKLEEISTETCRDMLGWGDSDTSYLIDFNFFLYCNKTGKYYTSIVHYNNSHWPGLGNKEWDIYKELSQIYQFDCLIHEGMNFVQENSYMFSQYRDSEVLGMMIEKWQYS